MRTMLQRGTAPPARPHRQRGSEISRSTPVGFSERAARAHSDGGGRPPPARL